MSTTRRGQRKKGTAKMGQVYFPERLVRKDRFGGLFVRNKNGGRVTTGDCSPADRVAGGGHPPPAPTERRERISRTTLFAA
jgi:hypothetical protein